MDVTARLNAVERDLKPGDSAFTLGMRAVPGLVTAGVGLQYRPSPPLSLFVDGLAGYDFAGKKLSYSVLGGLRWRF